MRLLCFILLFIVSWPTWAIEPPSILVYNVSTSQTVVSSNTDVVRPMASITKLMTAMIALDKYSLDDRVKIGKKSSTTVEQLLTNLLVRSDNNAAEVLAKYHPHGRSSFLDAMNAKAQLLGLTHTEYHDASGLIATNLTTANELAQLVAYAGTYPFIRQTSTLVEIETKKKIKNKVRTVKLGNTNKSILFEFDNILVSKTGYTSRAGRCLAMLVDSHGEQYAIIILGEPTKLARDNLARNLLQSGITNK